MGCGRKNMIKGDTTQCRTWRETGQRLVYYRNIQSHGSARARKLRLLQTTYRPWQYISSLNANDTSTGMAYYCLPLLCNALHRNRHTSKYDSHSQEICSHNGSPVVVLLRELRRHFWRFLPKHTNKNKMGQTDRRYPPGICLYCPPLWSIELTIQQEIYS